MNNREKLRLAAEKLWDWRHNPVKMVYDEFKVEPDTFQKKALKAFADPDKRRIAMKASKGPGKTTTLAWCIWNFLACYGDKGNHPKGAATSVSEKNIDDNLWPELAKWMGRSEFLKEAFDWTKNRVFAKDHPEDWFMSKRTWPKSADAQQQSETLAGLHADWLLFVLDESGGIPSAVMATAEAGLTAPWGKIIQAGNPTQLSGPLYDAVTRHRKLWYVITINGDPDNPKRAKRVPIQWAREQIKMYGRENPWVIVNVFGEFPPGSLNTLLSPDEVQAAMDRYGRIKEVDYQWMQRRLGVDVARFGGDRSVIFPRQGKWTTKPIEMRLQDTVQIAGRVQLADRNWRKEMPDRLDDIVTFVDDTGHWGHGVIDNLRAVGFNAIPVNFSAPGFDKRYKNRRAEMWLTMAEWIKSGGSLPPIDQLIPELTTPEYMFAGNQFIMEEKKQIKERLGFSPDLADALALTFAVPDISTMEEMAAVATGSARSYVGKAVYEYDPLAGDDE